MQTEVLAQYSAGMMLKRRYPPQICTRYAQRELKLYLHGRGQLNIGEKPLNRGDERQVFASYQKGYVVMRALAELNGEDSDNRALRTYLHAWA